MKMSVESGVFKHGTHGSVYRCPGRTRAGPCPAPARVRGEEIEGLVEDLILAYPSEGEAGRSPGRFAPARAALERTEHTLERYRDGAGAVTTLTPENFAKGLAKRQADVEVAAVRLAATERVDVDDLDPELETLWSGISVSQRRSAIEKRLDCIFVTAGDDPVTKRVYVFRRGRGPSDVPRRGVPVGELRPFDLCSHKGGRRLHRPRRWGPRRIERELLSWRRQAQNWPTYAEFFLAGRARLHHQVLAYGGIAYWAHRLGWAGAPRTSLWSEEAIEDGLRPLIAGRRVWPSAADFKSVGLSGLRRAVIRHEGIAHWADRSGLAMRTGSPKPLSINAPRLRSG